MSAWMNRNGLAGLLAATGVLVGCGSAAAQNLSCLSDEFNSASTLSLWSRVEQAEQWNTEPLQTWDVNGSTPGAMTMVPHTVTWYRDYRGPLAFKTVTGDFAITLAVRATARDGTSIPGSQFSLAGAMIRAPRAITPATWTGGGENYVFLSLGYGNAVPRRFQYEVKTTIDGDSQLLLSDAPGAEVVLQIVRIGRHVICLRQVPGGAWTVHARYSRADLPATLQVGLVAYTDWQKVSIFGPFVHNSNALTNPLPPGVIDPNPAVPFNPDLRATFDYARFASPVVPAPLIGADLSNPAAVSDAALLSFLGASLNIASVPCNPCPADFNGDSFLDFTDFDDFVASFEAGDPTGDFNADGFLDFTDFDAFVSAFEAGC